MDVGAVMVADLVQRFGVDPGRVRVLAGMARSAGAAPGGELRQAGDWLAQAHVDRGARPVALGAWWRGLCAQSGPFGRPTYVDAALDVVEIRDALPVGAPAMVRDAGTRTMSYQVIESSRAVELPHGLLPLHVEHGDEPVSEVTHRTRTWSRMWARVDADTAQRVAFGELGGASWRGGVLGARTGDVHRIAHLVLLEVSLTGAPKLPGASARLGRIPADAVPVTQAPPQPRRAVSARRLSVDEAQSLELLERGDPHERVLFLGVGMARRDAALAFRGELASR